jgi:AcrR family transcriptional regulator
VDPVQHAAKRRQIADAAAGVFAERGFDGATTAEICRAAGVSTGNLFHYFSSKREIFVAVLTGGEDETAARLAEAEANTDPLDGLLGFVVHLAAAARYELVPPLVLEAMLQAGRDPELAQRLEDTAADEQAGIVALLARAADAGLVDPPLPVDETASWLMNLVNALYLRAATEPRFDVAAAIRDLRLVVLRLLDARLTGSPGPGPPGS